MAPPEAETSALKTDRREVPGLNHGRACQPNISYGFLRYLRNLGVSRDNLSFNLQQQKLNCIVF